MCINSYSVPSNRWVHFKASYIILHVLVLYSKSTMVSFKFYLKLVIWFSNKTRNLSLTSWNFSFSSCVTLPTPSGLKLLLLLSINQWILALGLFLQTCFHVRDSHKRQNCSVLTSDRSLCSFLLCLKDPIGNTSACNIHVPHIWHNIRLGQTLGLDWTIPGRTNFYQISVFKPIMPVFQRLLNMLS